MQKELTLNTEMDFKMCACTQTDTCKNLPVLTTHTKRIAWTH